MDNNPSTAYLQQANIQPEIEELTKVIRSKLPQVQTQSNFGNSSIPSVNDVMNMGVDNRKQMFDNSTPFLDVYKPLSSGEYVSMYETYIPNIDNQERLAQQQSTGEKLFNGTTKALASFAIGVLGGTAGLVYGLEEALTDQKLSSLYDNDFSNWMNDFNTKLRYELPNYYTKEAQNMNFGQQIVGDTANFFADKFLGGLSFTASALVSEGIWAWATGGTSLATAGARLAPRLTRFASWGVNRTEDIADVLGGVAKYKSLLNSVPGQLYKAGTTSKDFAIGLGKAGDLISLGGKMARSAGYEASVEALQFKKEEEEKFYSNFADLNGREPNAEDIAQFEKDLEDRANMVFKVNTAILMPSNAIMMGSVLGMKNPFKAGLADFIDRKAFGYGLEKTAEGAFKTIERTGLQKASRFTFNYVAKPAVTEGLFEEGGQGLTTKYNSKWLEHTYDPKLSKETFDSIGAFNEAIGEQYGTKEGWVENGLGILIGIVGGSVNARSQMKQDAEELKYKEAMANTWQDKSLQQIILPSKIQTANRIKGFALEAKEEALKGNIAKSELAKKSGQLAFINGELVMGSSVSDITSKVSKAMDTLTEEQWKEAGVENVQEYKDNALTEINTLAKEWKTNKKYWQYVIGDKLVGEQNLTFGAIDGIVGNFGKNASIVEALAWQSTIGENANKIMEDVRVAVSNEVGEEHAKILGALKNIEEIADINKKQLKILQNQNKALKAKRTRLTNQITRLDTLEATDSQKTKRAEVTKALLETEEAINAISKEASDIADKINTFNANKQGLRDFSQTTLDSNFSGTTISSDDILRLDENIEKFQATLKSLGVSNPQRAKYLNELLEEYKQAKDVFLGAQATNRIVSSKDFKLENIGSFIGGKIAKNKAMNVDSQEWLQSVLNDYSKSVTSTTAQETEQVQKATITAEKDNTKTKPKSQEQINQEKIEALEAERRQKLAEVKTQKVFRTEGTGLGKLGVAHRGTGVYYALDKPFLTGTKGETVSELNVVLPENILDITVEENKQIFGEIQKIASERFNESDKTKPFNDLISEVAVEKGYDGIISYIEPEDTTQGREFVSFKGALKENNEIDKINREYDAKINALKPKSQNPLEQYKQRLETLLKTRYKDLISVEDETKPTQEEIQTFKDGKADDELKAKLSRWKLYDASIDEDGVSVADLITWINQAETTIEVEDTKDEIEVEDVEQIKDDLEGTNITDDYTLAQNTNGSATIVKPKDSNKYRLAHIKMQTLVDRLGGDFKVLRKGVEKDIKLDKLQPKDVVEVDGMSLTYLPGGQIEINQDDFLSRQQSLNLYIYNSGLNWSYKNLYEVKGNEFVKKSSDFAENEVNSEAIYDQKQGDKLTLEIDDIDGFNNTAFGGTKEQLKIYLVDSKGRKVSTLKAFREGKLDQDFAVIREEAFKRWEEQGRPSKMKLGIQVETENIFFGSPEIIMSENGTPKNIPITEAGVSQVVATGYIENGEISLNREIKDVSTVFVNKLSKNTSKKVPLIVIKKGAYSIAYPISMVKTATPQTELLDGILQATITPQEKVLKINEAILNQNIKTDKLAFDDINNQEKLDEVRKAFEDKKVFVDAKTLADKNYKIKNLVNDAQINIDLENLDQAISDAKLRVSYKNTEIKVTLDDKNNNLSEVETELSNLTYELAQDYANNADTKYLDSKGDIIEDTVYTNAFDDNEITKAESHLDKMHNIKVLKQALSEKLSKSLEKAIGMDKIRQIKSLIKQYDFLKKQIVVSEEELKEGKNNAKC